MAGGRTEAGALDRQKDVDVGERGSLIVVGAPALTQQVCQLPRTVGVHGGGRRRLSGHLVGVPATQRADQLVLAKPLVRPTRCRSQHLPHSHPERPYIALRRKPSLHIRAAPHQVANKLAH